MIINTLKNILSNNLIRDVKWQFLEKIVRLGLNTVLGIWFANSIGVDLFGKWSFVIVVVSLINVVLMMGLPNMIVKELIECKSVEKILFSTTVVRLAGSLICFGILLVVLTITDTSVLNEELFFLMAFTWVFNSFEFFEGYFISKHNSKLIAIIKIPVIVVLNLVKVVFLVKGVALLHFAWLYSLEIGFYYIILFFSFLKNSQEKLHFVFEWNVVKKILKKSWPLFLSGLAVYAYMRLDQIMIKSMVSSHSLGIYSTAVKIIEPLYIIPTSIVISALPILTKAKLNSEAKYLKKLQDLYFLMTWLSIIIILISWFGADYLIGLLFKPEFEKSGQVLKLYSLSFVFTCLGVTSAQFLLIENLQKVSFYRTFFGMILNVILNLLLIPSYQELGATYATIISYGFATFTIGYHKKARSQVLFMLKSFNFIIAFKRIKSYLKGE